MTAAEREAWLDRLCQQDDDPFDDPQEYWDPESCAPPPGQDEPPPGQDELTAEELAGVRGAAADEMLGLDAASSGRRGPGQAGSARVFPGESASRAAGFGVGMAWDVMPGCAQLAVAAEAAVDGGGPDDSLTGTADHELVGLVCAWDRLEAHMAACKLVAIAEVFRRNPEDGFEPEPGQMPAVVHEFTRDQLALALGESRAAADWLLTVAWHLATRLAGTLEALADGVITRGKAELIVRLTQHLDDDEAGAAEAKVLGRAGRLTPGGLRSAVARAVMEVAPDKARQRRETAAKFARVERWAEDSGNAARRRARLRAARTQGSQETRRPWPAAGRGRVFLHPGQPGRAARRVRHLAAAHPRRRARPDRRDRHPGHPPLRAPVRSPRPRSGVKLRHLSWVRHATCTSPVCRRPASQCASQCDFEHNTPYEAGGRTCLCNADPKCRHDHRLKQQPGWTVDQLADGTVRAGPHRPGAATTPNRPGTPSSEQRTRSRRCAGR
jgi:hypothetical protein